MKPFAYQSASPRAKVEKLDGPASLWGDLIRKLETALSDAPMESLPACIGDFARLAANAQARLLAAPPPAVHMDRLLTAEEAARLLGVTKQFLYMRRDLPFRRELSPGTIRFSAAGIAAYAKERSMRS